MIGQHKNLMKVQKWVKNNSFPRFLIIEGLAGSGRLTLSKEIIKRLKASGIIAENNSIDTVRQIIASAYNNSSPCVYIFRDVDDMSVGAKNALLKVVEECPNNAYFIMTVQNIETVLPTLRSRATSIQMEGYSLEERKQFTDNDELLVYGRTPLELKTPLEDLHAAQALVREVITILEGGGKGTDLLRCCSQLKNKEADKGVDCKIFYRVFTLSSTAAVLPREYLLYLKELDRAMQNKSINHKAALEVFLLKTYTGILEGNRRE